MIDWLRLTHDQPSRDEAASDDSDALLAARAIEEPAAFGLLFDRYAERVYRYCYRRLGDHAAAEDATSQVFAKALTGLPRFRPRDDRSFASWLFSIAHNVAADTLRRSRPHESLDAVAARASDHGLPEREALAAESEGAVRELLTSLPEDQRRVIELRLAGLTGPEIAVVLGRSHGAVKMLQHRAVAALRRRILISDAATAPEETRP